MFECDNLYWFIEM